MTEHRNIIQAEFFFDRGPKFKTAIRFFDQDGLLTDFVRHMRHYEDLRDRLVATFPKKPGWWRTIQDWRIRLLGRKLQKMRFTILQLTRCQLRAIVGDASRSNVAVENLDRSFRDARQHELWSVVEDAERAVGVWLFVFEPNELCANPVEGIAYAM